jgi:CheY-like chemotaxis protein
VADDGCGIDPQELGRIFEPFFSKKRTGESSGSGLGLAIVHGVVKEHDGFIDVVTTPGKGTSFSLYFPLARAKPEAVKPAAAAALRPARLLVVDDEEFQLQTSRRVLTDLGYEVDTTASGDYAHDLFRRAAVTGKNPYDLVIMDMVLAEPDDGLQVVERIRQLFPQQKAIMVSGHAPNERAELAVEKGLVWLAKPYTAQALTQAVERALAIQDGDGRA